jgi:hydrogenase maturation protease
VTLVIGIGNPLRGDDGVGWWLLAELAAAAPVPGRTLRRVQQLTPELAAELAVAERALFVDAWLAPPGAGPRLLEETAEAAAGGGGPGAAGSHHLTPATLLAMASLLFGRRPPAAQLLVPAFVLGHGDDLSAATRALLPAARRLLRGWLAQGGRPDA